MSPPQKPSLRDHLAQPGVQKPLPPKVGRPPKRITDHWPGPEPLSDESGPEELPGKITLYANPKVPVSPEGGGTKITRGELGTPIQEGMDLRHFVQGEWYGRCDPLSQRKIDNEGVSQPLPVRLVGGPCDGQNYCGPPSGLCPERLMMIQLRPVPGDLLVEKAALFQHLDGPRGMEEYHGWDWKTPEDRRTIYTFDRLATDEELMIMNQGRRILWEEEADAV